MPVTVQQDRTSPQLLITIMIYNLHFFLVEFEQNGFEVHKDDIVVIAEAVHEFNRIIFDALPIRKGSKRNIFVHWSGERHENSVR